ncbi:MAG: FAD-binding oxidoreductase [Methanobacteriota archaeon]
MRVETSSEAFEEFLTDESNAHYAEPGSVEAVYFPASESELAEILRDASLQKKKVTVSGAGTGVTGARVPKSGGLVVSMAEMVRIEARDGFERVEYLGLAGPSSFLLDRSGLRAVVPPGIPLLELTGALPKTAIYPPDPTETSAQVGGTVATNASGARCFNYGATREWVQGLRVVLTNGDTLGVKRGKICASPDGYFDFRSEQGNRYRFGIPTYKMPAVKHNAGLYSKPGMDLVDLFVGSEGILGAISQVELRLAPKPGGIASDIAFFRTGDSAMRFADWLRPMRAEGILSVEYFDENSLGFIREENPEVPEGAGGAIFFEMACGEPSSLAPIEKRLRELGSTEDWCANNERDVRGLKEFRHSLPDRVNAYLRERRSHKMGTDMAVPDGRFGEMMEAYSSAGAAFSKAFPRPGAHFVLFGHAGDCHLHFNFISENAEELAMAKNLYVGLAERAVSLGGTLSGEHGMGKKVLDVRGKPTPYIELMYGRKGMEEIASVKKALDPRRILNAGNVVPASHL